MLHNTNKWQSRKLLVWVISSGMTVFLVATDSPHAEEMLRWWCGITMVWMGVQGGADIMGEKNEKNKNRKTG